MKLTKVRVLREFLHSEDGLTGKRLSKGAVDFVRDEFFPGLAAEGYVSKWWPEEEAKAVLAAPENKAIPLAPSIKRGTGRPRKAE
jgi:hypothetical protein